MTDWKEQIKKIEQCPQRQDSLTNQIEDLHFVANKLGFYDAADHIKFLFLNKKCELNINYDDCSSKEYGQECITCHHYK